ncbi:MAG TPA: TIGR03663 family protein [Methanocorpusculum sp.]|nr:TIGR03663 family protein [Methanocorpusculum sp.]
MSHTVSEKLNNLKSKIRPEHIIFAILIIAIILRFCFLDLKLYHHDETIHAWFSYNLMQSWHYTYDPVYHGPFLYYVTASMFKIFGASDIVGRILPCIFGCGMVLLVYWLYKMGYLSGKTACISAMLLAISPEMVYFSRFLRNDIFVVFFSLLMAAAFLAWIQKEKWYYLAIAGIGCALGLCSKENMPLIFVTFAVFVIYLLWSRKIRFPKGWVKHLIITLLIFFGIVFTFYTSFWQHPEMIIQAPIDAITGWIGLHNEGRLNGSPLFYIAMFILYEIPILLLALLTTGVFISEPFLKSKKDGVAKSDEDVQSKTFGEKLKEFFKRPDAPEKIDRQHEFLRFAIYWTLIAMITYAYIGEKVPWLSLHQLVPMIFVAASAFMLLKKFWKPILIISAVILLSITYYTSFVPEDIAEPIVQVQNSQDLVPLLNGINESNKVLFTVDKQWPFGWYCRGDDYSKIRFANKIIPKSEALAGNYDIIVTHDTQTYDHLDGYKKETIRHSYWINAWELMSVGNAVKYYFTRFFVREPIGSYNLNVFTKI